MFCMRAENDILFVSGSNDVDFVSVVEIDLIFQCWLKWLGYRVGIIIHLSFAWGENIDLIATSRIGVDLSLFRGTKILGSSVYCWLGSCFGASKFN